MAASTKLTAPVTAGQVEQLRFTPVRGRQGYTMGEVDAFLDRVVATVSGTGDLTSEEVKKVRFTPVRWREAYDMDEVDAALDAIIATLDQPSRSATPSGEAAPATTPQPCLICFALVLPADEDAHRGWHVSLASRAP